MPTIAQGLVVALAMLAIMWTVTKL